MSYLYQDEIKKLEDKDLQLRYLLGGLNSKEKIVCESHRYWSCDIRCSCTLVPDDDRLLKIKKFIEKHNISNETFMRLVLSYLNGYIVKYNGEYGELILELDKALMDYKFIHSTVGKVIENNLKEKELLELLEKYSQVEESLLYNFLNKYSLTPMDFMVLAKTSINYNFNVIRGLEIKDLPIDLAEILKGFDLYVSREYVQQYHKLLEEKKKLEKIEAEMILKKQNQPKVLTLFENFGKK